MTLTTLLTACSSGSDLEYSTDRLGTGPIAGLGPDTPMALWLEDDVRLAVFVQAPRTGGCPLQIDRVWAASDSRIVVDMSQVRIPCAAIERHFSLTVLIPGAMDSEALVVVVRQPGDRLFEVPVSGSL